MNSSQVLDIFSLIVVAYFTIKGATRGLVSQITWIGALILCFKFSGLLTPLIEPAIAVDPPLRKWIAMAIVYIGLCLGVFLAAGMLRNWLEKAKLNDFDRHLGSILGLSIGVVVCMTALFFLLTIWPSSLETIRRSWSGRTAGIIINQVDPLLHLTPEGAEDQVRAVIHSYQEKLFPGENLAGGTHSDEEAFGGAEGSDSESSGFDLAKWLQGAGSDSGAASPPAGTPGLEDLLNLLPPAARDHIGTGLLSAWNSASAAERQKLIRQVANTIPAQTGAVLDEFVSAGNQAATPASGGAVELSRADQNLLKEIAEIYGPIRNVADRAREYLAGVPPEVQHGVLEDWHADVMILRNDPDPGTDVTATVDQRIVRQMRRFGLPLDRLDQAVRNRLNQSPQ